MSKVLLRPYMATVIDIFEEFLDEKGVEIPNPERDAENDPNAAHVYGNDYDEMLEKLSEPFLALADECGVEADVDHWE